MRLLLLFFFSCSLALKENSLSSTTSNDPNNNFEPALTLISTSYDSYNKESKQVVSVKNCPNLNFNDLECNNCRILEINPHGNYEHYVTILAHKTGHEVSLFFNPLSSCYSGNIPTYGKYFFKESPNAIVDFKTTVEDGNFLIKNIEGSNYKSINNKIFFKHDLYFKYPPHEHTYLKISYGVCNQDFNIVGDSYEIVIDLYDQIKSPQTVNTSVIYESSNSHNFRFIDHALTLNPESSFIWQWNEQEKKLSFYLDKKKVAFANNHVYADEYNNVTPDPGLKTAAKNYCLEASYYEEGDTVVNVNNSNLVSTSKTYQKKIPVVVGTALFNTSEHTTCPDSIGQHQTYYSLGAVHEEGFKFPNSNCQSAKIAKKPSFFETKYLDFAEIEPLKDLSEVASFNNFTSWFNNYFGSYLSFMPLKDTNFTCPPLLGVYQNNNSLNQFEVRSLWQGLTQGFIFENTLCRNQSHVLSDVDLLSPLKTDGTWFKNQLPFNNNFLPELTMIHNRIKDQHQDGQDYFSLEASIDFYSASETLDVRARLKGSVVKINDLENPAEIGPGSHNLSGDRDLFRESNKKFTGGYAYILEVGPLFRNTEELFNTDVLRQLLNDEPTIRTHVHTISSSTNYQGDNFYPLKIQYEDNPPDSYWKFVIDVDRNFKEDLISFIQTNGSAISYLGKIFITKVVEIFLDDNENAEYNLTEEYKQKRISETLFSLKNSSYPLTIGIYHTMDLFPTMKNGVEHSPFIFDPQSLTPFYHQYVKMPLVNYSYLIIDYGY